MSEIIPPEQVGLIERTSDFIHSHGLGFAIGALAAVGGAGTALLSGESLAEGASSHEAAMPHVEHRATPIITQNILDNIRHDIMPCNPGIGCTKGVYQSVNYIHPATAMILSDGGHYTESCNDRDALFSFYGIEENGLAYKTCEDIDPSSSLHSYAGEYQGAMNQLGLKIEKTIGLSYPEEVSEVSGSRNKVEFDFGCTDYEGNPMNGVERITLQRAFKTIHKRVVEKRGHHKVVKWVKEREQYSKTTATPCPTVNPTTITSTSTTPTAQLLFEFSPAN